MGDEIRILHVEDEPDFATLTQEFLQRHDDRFEIEHAASAPEGLECLSEARYDCVVSDYDMPEMDGIAFLESIREEYPELPFILFTGKGSEEVASEAISAGATDYIQKEGGSSQYTVLANRIENAVEQYRSSREVEAQRERLLRVYERITDGFFAVDTNWRYTHSNEEGARLVGKSREELIGERVWDVFPELEDSPFGETLRRAMDEQVTTTEEAYYPPHETWYDVTVYPDEDGISIYFRDSSIRKEREQELERKERRYQAVFNDPNILVGLIDTDGTVLDINDTAMSYIDADLDDVVGEPFWETPWFSHSASIRQQVKEGVEQAAEGEYVDFEYDLERPSGERYTIEGVIRPVTDDDGEVMSLLISDRDITDRKDRERALEETQRRYETILRHQSDYIFVIDDSATITYVSPSIERVMGFDPNEVVGTDALGYIHPDHRERAQTAFFETIEDAEEEVTVEFKARKADESYSWIEARGSNYFDNPAIEGVMVNVREISDRKRREEGIAELHAAAREFYQAADPDRVAELIVDTFEESLDLPISCVWFHDEEENVLRPVMVSDEGADKIDAPPVFEAGEGLTWEVFESGEAAWFEDVSTVEGRYNPDTNVRSEIILALGDHGAVSLGSLEADAFDEIDVSLAETVASHATMALDRIARERELETVRERYQAYVEQTSDIITVLNANGVIQYHSPAVERVLGFDRESMLGDQAFEYVHPDDRQKVAEEFYELTTSEAGTSKTMEFRFRNADDEWVWVEAIGSNRHHTAIDGFVITTRDISDRKAREAELERYRRIVEASGDPIYVLDPDGNFTFVNDALTEITGYEQADLVGERASKVMSEADFERGSDIIANMLSTGQRRGTFEMELQPESGPPIPCENHLSLLFDGEDFRGTAGVLRDISDRKARERELERQNERLDEFASVVSHDLRNPLGVVSGHLELAAEDCPSEHLEPIEDAVERMERLIEDLLALARQGERVGEMEPVELAPLIKQSNQTVENPVELQLDIDATIRADRSRLEQLIENLLRNASEHAGSHPTVTVGRLADGFYVEDDGSGIPPEDREEVFSAGFSTKEDNTGIGLSIVKRIALAHDWTIDVTDGESNGARFELTGVGFVSEN